MESLCTIVMPLFNKEAYLREAVQSVLDQSTTYSFRLLIADDCSTDSSLQIAKSLREKNPDIIEIYESDCNRGLLSNDIRVFEKMDSDYFCVLDPDDYWIDVHFLDKAITFLENHPDYVCYSSNTVVSENGKPNRSFIEAPYAEYTTDSIEDYFAEKAVIPHTTASVYRNVIFKNFVPDFIRSAVGTESEASFRGEHGRFVIHLKYGKAYFKNEYVGVYRLNNTGIWTSSTQAHKEILNAQAFFDYAAYYDNKYVLEAAKLAKKYYERAINEIERRETEGVTVSMEDYAILTSIGEKVEKYCKEESCFAEILSKMVDETSLELLNCKVDSWAEDKNSMIIYMATSECKWQLIDYDNFNRRIQPGQKLIVYGTCSECLMTCVILAQIGMRVDALCLTDDDAKLQDFTKMYLNVSVSELDFKYRTSFVVIASRHNGAQLYANLLGRYFPRENIFLPRIGLLYATTGFQYFDCPYITPQEGEVFVDCGAYDALNSVQFAEWCNNRYDKIIAFEPSVQMYESIKNNINLPRFDIYPWATGAKRHKAFFSGDESTSSMVAEMGTETVLVETIDNVLKGDYCSFIKIDVEGAELDTLKGAANTIKTYKPRLAICIYHKSTDISEILPFVESLRVDYRYCVRHYTSCDWETVLYAF